MQRRLVVSAMSALVLGLGAFSQAYAFQEGQDWVKLEHPMENAQGTLIKLWSYACPFCYKFDVGVDPQVMPRIEKEAGLKFKPVHLESKGDYGRVASEVLAGLELDDEAHGRPIESSDSLFKKAKNAWYVAYHKKQERWSAGEKAFLQTAADATGLSTEKLLEMGRTPEAQALADEWKKSYEVAKIQGVPAYVVNGKYLIMTKSIRGFDGFVDLVKELAKK